MFKRLKLTNFRQHRDREIIFTPGVNALRGANEAGKTTFLEAAAYVMFGAVVALREALPLVVTYGEKESSLKVELDIEISGVTYFAKRSKAGAEVWVAGGVKPVVVGQNECTKFFEAQFMCSAKVAANLMLANQGALRGALEEGPSAPMVLIETLANFKLIDNIISLVGANVPNGHTKTLEENVERLKGQIDAPVEADNFEVLQAAANDAEALLQAADADLDLARKACTAHAPLAEAARAAERALEDAQAFLRAAQANLQRAEDAVKIQVPDAPDEQRIAELRKQGEDRGRWARAKQAHDRLKRLGTPSAEWDEGMDKLRRERQESANAAREAETRVNQLGIEITRIESRLVKERECSFCGKDLTDVPEVQQRNRDTEAQLKDLNQKLALAKEALSQHQGDIADFDEVLSAHSQFSMTYQACAEFIKLDENYVPARWTWIGPDVAVEPGDPTAELTKLVQQGEARTRALGRLEQARASLGDAETALTAAELGVATAKVEADKGKPCLARAEELATAYATAEATFRQQQEAAQRAVGEVKTAAAVRRERQAARERLQADLERARSNLEETVKGNLLLKKLRTARPQIADKLWAVVLASVSTYFSHIRGTKSVVTRADNGFLVDGQPITGLSGSTLDALGLAIRIALTKTFLPNARFLVLDEPAAACDDNRESNMIGLLAASDFDQVVLVTHSELADAFAQQVIHV
jgi:DNA repair exonuclease SbcCD ATPase subunit